jgi:hypothetical protein
MPGNLQTVNIVSDPPPPTIVVSLTNSPHSLSPSLSVDRLCGLVVRVPGYRTETYCFSYEVRTEFIHVK